jgi:hypothetical protein
MYEKIASSTFVLALAGLAANRFGADAGLAVVLGAAALYAIALAVVRATPNKVDDNIFAELTGERKPDD